MNNLKLHLPQEDERVRLIEDLQSRNKKDLKSLFWQLEVPEVAEFNGEFQGFLLNQGGRIANSVTGYFINRRGQWLGKAFQPRSEINGRGYNIFRNHKGIERCLRMQVHRRELEDGQHSLTIEYAAENHGVVGGICDKVWRLAPGLFVGIGNVPLGGRIFPRLKQRVMFGLVGPVGEFQETAADRDTLTPADDFASIAA